MNAWIGTLRLRTLPAAATPVVVGTAYANRIGAVAWGPAIAALVAALLIQIGTNLANDYFDFKKGADQQRVGPVRASSAGLIPPLRVRNAALCAFALAAVLGLYLVSVAGWPILVIGAASILSGWGYTAGPKPLAYIGLGDLFVLVFFGPVAVAGTVYVQSLTWESGAMLWGIALGLLATAILVVNNVRDAPTDGPAGKRTLVVRFGTSFGKAQYLLCMAGAVAVAALVGHLEQDLMLLLPIAAMVLAIKPTMALMREGGPSLNPVLGQTALVLLLYGLLLSVAL
jgi:1,4-dihydroxy-2-naphthoate octaprenyltransferase